MKFSRRKISSEVKGDALDGDETMSDEEEDEDERTFSRVSITTIATYYTLRRLNENLEVLRQSLDDRDHLPSVIELREALRSTMEYNESMMGWSDDLLNHFRHGACLSVTAGEKKKIEAESREMASKLVPHPVERPSSTATVSHNDEISDSPATPETSPVPVRKEKKSKKTATSKIPGGDQVNRPKANDDGGGGGGIAASDESKSKDDEDGRVGEQLEGEPVLDQDETRLQLQRQARAIVAEVEGRFNEDSIVLVAIPVLALVLDRLERSFDPNSPSLIDVVDIAKDLMILVRNNPRLIKMFASKDNQLGQQLMARAKQLEAENPTYGYYKDTIGSLLSGLGRSTSKSTTEKETSASDSVTVDLSPFDGYARALRQFESRTDQSGKQPELDGGATKDEVAKLRIKIKYGRLLKLVASNVIHLAIWFDFCDCVSMDLLFGGADSLLRKPAKITKDSLLVKARTLWDLVVVDTPFDPLRTTFVGRDDRSTNSHESSVQATCTLNEVRKIRPRPNNVLING